MSCDRVPYDRDAIASALQTLQSEGKVTFERNKPLAECSTFRIGGPADFVVYPGTSEACAETLSVLMDLACRHLVIGNGSNLLFADEGYDGVIVITSRMNHYITKGNTITAEAGVPLTALAAEAARAGLSGLEFAFGIPGTVGGAVYMNGGAYGGEIADVLTGSRYYNPHERRISERDASDHRFSYRHSVYMEREDCLLDADFTLVPGDPEAIRTKMSENMAARREKQPLEYPSAGSVFKRYPGYYTGRLIEECGLKGLRIGDAQVSEKHAGFIVNRGHATASDVLALIDRIREEIYRRYQIEIECEVRYIR